MKKIVFKKFANDCLFFFLITIVGLGLIIWVFQAVNYFDIVVEDGRSYIVYIKYSLLNLPKIISKILPFCIFLSFTYTISRYEIENQLVIFWNFGVNKITIVNYFFKLSILLVLFQLFLNAYIVPKTLKISRNLLKESNVNLFENFLKPKKFIDAVKNLTVYTDVKDLNGNLKNVYIKKIIDDSSYQITYAKNGEFKKIRNNEILTLYNGETINFNLNQFTIFKFTQSNFILSDLDTGTITLLKTQEQTTEELFKCISYLINSQSKKNNSIAYANCKNNNLKDIYREIYKRIIIPFYTILLILISLFLIIPNKENINYTNYRIIIFTIGFTIIICAELSLRYLQNNFNENLKIILIPFVLILITYLYFNLKFKEIE